MSLSPQSTSGYARRQMTGDDLLRRTIAAHKGGRLTEAEVGYARILRQRPNDPDALNFLGLLRFHQGDSNSALESLQRSVESNPDNPHARINLGNVLAARNELDAAHASFVRATELAPELAGAWYNLAICLRRMKRPEDAAAALFKTLELEKGYSEAHEALALLLYRLGRFEEAANVYRDWLKYEPNSAVAHHMLAAVSGKDAPDRGSDEFVTMLFNRFAETFDENLADLGYRAPQLLAERLMEHIADDRRMDILDAGCGTGLAAPLLKPRAARLVGVDLSAGMLAKAQTRALYDELAVGELCAFMRARPQQFDVVFSADTLCYFGKLEEPLAAVADCLRAGGTLLFSVEAWSSPEPGASFNLQPHGRYQHTESYLQRAAEAEGFTVCRLDQKVLRTERGRDVIGHLLVATR